MVREADGTGSAEAGWDTVRGGLTDAVGRAVCGVWTARAAVAATRIQRMIRERWAGGWLGDSLEETKPLVLTVATWNTRKFKMSLRLSLASWEKLEWLGQRLEDSQCDLIVLQELEGSMHVLRRMRRWFARRGFEVAFLPGMGGSNGVAMAWRASSWTANGTVKALAPRVLGVELRRLADGKLVRMVGLHGMHGEEEKSVQ